MIWGTSIWGLTAEDLGPLPLSPAAAAPLSAIITASARHFLAGSSLLIFPPCARRPRRVEKEQIRHEQRRSPVCEAPSVARFVRVTHVRLIAHRLGCGGPIR